MEEANAAAPVAAYLARALYWVFLGILFVNVVQRRHQKKAERKRFATLYIALGVFVIFILSQGIVTYGGADWMLAPAFIVVAAVLYRFRDHTFPFRLTSPVDGRRLTWDEIMFDDNHGDDPSSADEDKTEPEEDR
tara:strand:+ start:889 stop:1293 length:405 start_codon:yes stop_codon:yes gene_type:complete